MTGQIDLLGICTIFVFEPCIKMYSCTFSGRYPFTLEVILNMILRGIIISSFQSVTFNVFSIFLYYFEWRMRCAFFSFLRIRYGDSGSSGRRLSMLLI